MTSGPTSFESAVHMPLPQGYFLKIKIEHAGSIQVVLFVGTQYFQNLRNLR